MSLTLWQKCLIYLQNKLSSTEFSMWIRPLHAELNNNSLILYAPNHFVLDWVEDKYFNIINEILNLLISNNAPLLEIKVGVSQITTNIINKHLMITNIDLKSHNFQKNYHKKTILSNEIKFCSNINSKNNFSNFIEGKSNQLARSIAYQVANYVTYDYNPLYFYSNTGLGKTHLLHAIGNEIICNNIKKKIVYINSERFVNDMLKAIHNDNIEKFKKYYCSVNLLLIDDIQFFANKYRCQEEFFYILSFLLEEKKQVILTSDCYPKEIHGIDDRLKSRFYCGLIIAIKSPDLETRIAILMKKAAESNVNLNKDVAYFIAKHLISNVRELEGALNRVIANSNFIGCNITIKLAKETLHDMLYLQKKIITIHNIQKTIAEYYRIKISDLLSKNRSRSVVRPRQMAMAITKEISNHSLPEIGNAFGGRDHTTVIHACRKIKQLREENFNIKEDFFNLMKILSS